MAKVTVYSEERRNLYGQVFKKGDDGRFSAEIDEKLIDAYGLPNSCTVEEKKKK